jgi:hypothetical protein
MKRCVLLAFCLVCIAIPASATEAIHWKKVGYWDVLMDQTMGNACYATTSYEGGSVLRVGFNFSGPENTMYFALGNENWKSIEAGKDYEINIVFDSQAPWKATALGVDFAEAKWLYVNGLKTDFATDFSRKHGLTAYFQGREVARLTLKGSSKAFDEMIACQDAVNEVMAKKPQQPASPPSDPFAPASGVKNATDPFEL